MRARDVNEPAIRNYFFGDSYKDLAGTIKKAFTLNLETIRKRKKQISDSWALDGIIVRIIKTVMNLFAILSVFLFGTIYTIVLSAVHICILLVVMLLFYIVFSIVWAIDRLYLALHRIRYDCPECKKRVLIPNYVCPDCGEVHTQLVPGKYGVWKHKCECGNKIPCTFINGRMKLTSVCPMCGHEHVANGIRPIVFQLIGGSKSGKTVFLAAFFHQYFERLDRNAGISYRITDQYKPFFHDLETWYGGVECPATAQLDSQMYPVVIDASLDVDRQFSIYDIAGEMFNGTTMDSQQLQQQFHYCDGLLFLVDPFSEGSLREDRISARGDIRDFSDMPADHVATNFINYFISTKHYNANSKRSDKPLSIIIAKADEKEIKKNIGPARIHAEYNKHQTVYGSLDNCRDQLCRKFLLNIGFVSMVNEMEGRFSNVHYFPVSAMGHSQDGSVYEPWGVWESVSWMIPMTDKRFSDAIS